jgi:hypothetical protein
MGFEILNDRGLEVIIIIIIIIIFTWRYSPT